jgi:hypothetical protein
MELSLAGWQRGNGRVVYTVAPLRTVSHCPRSWKSSSEQPSGPATSPSSLTLSQCQVARAVCFYDWHLAIVSAVRVGGGREAGRGYGSKLVMVARC